VVGPTRVEEHVAERARAGGALCELSARAVAEALRRVGEDHSSAAALLGPVVEADVAAQHPAVREALRRDQLEPFVLTAVARCVRDDEELRSVDARLEVIDGNRGEGDREAGARIRERRWS